ncbi:MAG: hypothetical protein WC273_10530 [Dehalococcoidia bacterium]
MTATAALPRPGASEVECRRCRAARSIGRIALFVVGGVAASLAISWVITLVPALGVVLAVLGILLLARSVVRLFSATTPIRAATQLGISIGIGSLVSALAALVAR